MEFLLNAKVRRHICHPKSNPIASRTSVNEKVINLKNIYSVMAWKSIKLLFFIPIHLEVLILKKVKT